MVALVLPPPLVVRLEHDPPPGLRQRGLGKRALLLPAVQHGGGREQLSEGGALAGDVQLVGEAGVPDEVVPGRHEIRRQPVEREEALHRPVIAPIQPQHGEKAAQVGLPRAVGAGDQRGDGAEFQQHSALAGAAVGVLGVGVPLQEVAGGALPDTTGEAVHLRAAGGAVRRPQADEGDGMRGRQRGQGAGEVRGGIDDGLLGGRGLPVGGMGSQPGVGGAEAGLGGGELGRSPGGRHER